MSLRATLSGDLEKLEIAEAKRAQTFSDEIAQLEAELSALNEKHACAVEAHQKIVLAVRNKLVATDLMLAQHEIQIDPSLIPPIRRHNNPAIGQYGDVSRHIYGCFRQAQGKPLTTTQIADYVVACLGISLDTEVRIRIRKRLQSLARFGKLERLHCLVSGVEGRWQLSEGVQLKFRSEIPLLDDDLASILSTIENAHC